MWFPLNMGGCAKVELRHSLWTPWTPLGDASLKDSQDLSSGVAKSGELNPSELSLCFCILQVTCSAFRSKIDRYILLIWVVLLLEIDLLIM
jgi:hypothetical protein